MVYVWLLRESESRDGGLTPSAIPCVDLRAGYREADNRAGRMLNREVAWENYGVGDTMICRPLIDGTWQHLWRVELVGA